MSRLFAGFFFLAVASLSFLAGSGLLQELRAKGSKKMVVAGISPERDAPLKEYKAFAIVFHAHNAASWCERALRSVFEQNYESYRVLFVDDASTDGTFETAQRFIVENKQQHRVIALRNDEPLGAIASLYRAAGYCQDKEILVPLSSSDWLTHDKALSRLNQIFQNPDVWIALGQSIEYPAYRIQEPPAQELCLQTRCPSIAFYSALFKSIPLVDLFVDGAFAKNQGAYLSPLLELAGGRVRSLSEPLVFENCSQPARITRVEALERVQRQIHQPLSHFPSKPINPREGADIVLFSYDRPLQLFATLESIQRYLTGDETITVLYRVSDERFDACYETVKAAFPKVRYLKQSKTPRKDFKKLLLKAVQESPSEYLLFAVDDIIMTDFVDLVFCRQMLEKTGAYGFYLRFGRHINYSYMHNQSIRVPPSVALANGIYAWDLKKGELDWGFANSMDMTLFRKADITPLLERLKYKSPNSLEFEMNGRCPSPCIGLYFDQAKLVNIPLNMVNLSDCPHMNYMSTEEMLVKFNAGYKIDIDPFFRIENPSPHFDMVPEFVLR